MDPKSAIKGGSFCPVPWTGFIMYPNGNVKNCVLSEEYIGNINSENIEDILHGTKNTEIKSCMNAHKKHPGCVGCHKLEEGTENFNVRSDRYYYLKALSSVPYTAYDTMDTELATVDMRWRNTCNLACVYCEPSLSSTWAKELNETIEVDEQQLAQTKEYVLANAPNLKNVYLAGGEPLLMKENSELLDRLDPSCTVRINTNLSNIKGPVFKRASKFRNVHWTVSVETMGAEFEYIRHGAKWNTFIENLKVITELDHKISFNMLWLVLNPYTVFDTVDYFSQLGYQENSFVIGPITSPVDFDVRNLPDTILEELGSILDSRIQSTDSRYLLNNSYINLKKHLELPFTKQPNKTKERLQGIDDRRGLNSKNVFDIYQYL
jgi:radical SAM protein with 4Fe4S-binding SPASM domain